jgi:BirA family biotin operon repressor/biotin-[acetyl-CoA-carboxylase] ligase
LKWRIERHAEVGSTNDLAMARGREGEPGGLVVVADAQTKGRGRQGRSWHSPPGESLYVSALVRPALPLASVPPITLAAAVAVCDAVNLFAARASIKWPNDVLADGRKLAGILTETSTRGDCLEAVVIGVGLNVNAGAFPPELEAISLRQILGREVPRDEVLAALLEELGRRLDQFFAGGLDGVLADWRSRSQTIGARVITASGEGIATDVAPDGALLVTLDGGAELRVVAGEVLQRKRP